MSTNALHRRKFLPEMDGPSARWYARLRGTDRQLADWRRQADGFAADVPARAAVLEIACGPGYLSVELARRGLQVSAIGISPTFALITTEQAREAGVPIDVRLGDAAELPFPDETFHLVVCQAAFKNFTRPQVALDEMYRVLRPGGTAVVQDMRREATAADIRQEVERLGLGRLNAMVTRRTLAGLRRRAYRAEDLRRLARGSAFGDCVIHQDGIGHDVRLSK